MKLIKTLAVLFIVKPLVHIGLGLNIINRKHLPQQGPAIIAANHNSHLDTLVLLALFPITQVHKVRPVAAADYFLKNKLIAWFSLKVLDIIPLSRSATVSQRKTLFDECHKALQQGDILLIFPEGSRGEPEVMGELKKGIFHLLKPHPNAQVYPVVMRGLGMSLPKGTALFVPFNCDIVLGCALSKTSCGNEFITKLKTCYAELAKHCIQADAIDEDTL